MSNPAPSETVLETTLMIARRHRKVINHYLWMLDRLTMPEAERLAIQMRIAEEEAALAEIGRLAGGPEIIRVCAQGRRARQLTRHRPWASRLRTNLQSDGAVSKHLSFGIDGSGRRDFLAPHNL